ncbi:hypothetical protein FDECE_800 [Fusarium decemcellulare]|nr:hypothetical protein FDECE_800 [Fusarium decemcellulare]
MKSLYILLSLASASMGVDIREAALDECCYLYDLGGNTQLFRTSELSAHVLGTPGSWCIAEINRDANDPNNCAAATAEVIAGYCELNVPAKPVACP